MDCGALKQPCRLLHSGRLFVATLFVYAGAAACYTVYASMDSGRPLLTALWLAPSVLLGLAAWFVIVPLLLGALLALPLLSTGVWRRYGRRRECFDVFWVNSFFVVYYLSGVVAAGWLLWRVFVEPAAGP